jgi:hypothetical protein
MIWVEKSFPLTRMENCYLTARPRWLEDDTKYRQKYEYITVLNDRMPVLCLTANTLKIMLNVYYDTTIMPVE